MSIQPTCILVLKKCHKEDDNILFIDASKKFEEEEPIDTKAVMAEIKELETKRAELDKEIEVYLKELGIV